jgi:hypothetical protein
MGRNRYLGRDIVEDSRPTTMHEIDKMYICTDCLKDYNLEPCDVDWFRIDEESDHNCDNCYYDPSLH